MDWLRWILLLVGAAIVAAIWWTGYRRARERDETLFERARRDPGLDPAGQSAAPDESAEVADSDSDLPPDLDVSTLEPFPADHSTPDLEIGDVAGRRGPVEPRAADTPEPVDDPEPAQPARAEPAPGPSAQRTARTDRSAEKAGPGEGGTDAGERIESVFLVASGGERFVGSRLQELFTRHGLRHGEMGIFHLYDPEGHVQFSVANLVEPGTFDPATMDTLSTPGIALFVRLPGPPSAEVAFDRMIRTARSMADQLEARLLDGQQSTLTRQTEQHLRDQMRDWDHRNPRSRA